MPKKDLILFAVLVMAAIWRWSPLLATDDVLPDEQVYLRAARHLTAGESPYVEPGYFYPPPVAVFVSALAPVVSEIDALRLLRGLGLAGILLTVWLSLRLVSWPPWLASTFAGCYVIFAPAVGISTSLGNAAGLATGLVLVGLVSWEKRPILAGVSLGLGLAIKPIAPIAPILLALHRPRRATRSHLVAAGSSLAAAIAFVSPHFRHLPDLLDNARGHTNPYNFSLHKLLSDLGLPLAPVLLLALVGIASVAFVRRRDLQRDTLLALTVTANLLALPILWAHSLLLLLPVQLLALDHCFHQIRLSRHSSGRPPIAVMLCMLALLSTFLAQAVGTTYGLPTWTGVVSRATPLVSIPFLGWFVVQGLGRDKAAAARVTRSDTKAETS